ncbi:hypothetical protein [Edaphobacter aggregans]|nr:hypothetical protein [Edaphobacter aggregans]
MTHTPSRTSIALKQSIPMIGYQLRRRMGTVTEVAMTPHPGEGVDL